MREFGWLEIYQKGLIGVSAVVIVKDNENHQISSQMELRHTVLHCRNIIRPLPLRIFLAKCRLRPTAI
jgi:hypothetical protein